VRIVGCPQRDGNGDQGPRQQHESTECSHGVASGQAPCDSRPAVGGADIASAKIECDVHQLYRIRGSRTPYTMSTARLVTMKRNPLSIVTVITACRSRLPAADAV